MLGSEDVVEPEKKFRVNTYFSKWRFILPALPRLCSVLYQCNFLFRKDSLFVVPVKRALSINMQKSCETHKSFLKSFP